MVGESEEVLRRAFGRRVAECRQDLGLTQEELAAKLRIPAKYLQQIEGGRQNVTFATQVKLADGLGVDLRTLFDPPRDPTPPRPGRPKAR